MADIFIYGTIKSVASDGKSAYSEQLWDEAQGKFQSEINEENSITQQEFDAIFND